MNTILEHLTYLTLLLCLGGFIFLTSGIVLIAEEGAKLMAVSVLRIATVVRLYAARHFRTSAHAPLRNH